ncbi:unnamed protein product [Parajaminaea phylloscopi]
MRSDDGDDSATVTDASDIASALATSQSVASVATTSTSARSIASTFSTLDDDDVHFFDQVIAALPSKASSFKLIKDAFTTLAGEPASGLGQTNRRDEHRWAVLLSLTKVRGSDWSDKWDTVRMGLGLDIRGIDPTVSTSGISMSDSVEDTDTDADAGRSDGDVTATEVPRSASEWTQETSQSEGSDADGSSQASSGRTWLDRDRGSDRTTDGTTDRTTASPHPSTTPSNAVRTAKSDLGGTSSYQSTEPASNEYDVLRARMEYLSRRAGQLAIQAQSASAREGPVGTETRAIPSAPGSPTAVLSARLARLLSAGSESDSPRGESGDDNAAHDMRRATKIDSMIAACRSSRESVRELARRRAAESEEAAYAASAALAQRFHNKRLLLLSWTWWFQRLATQREMYRNALASHRSHATNSAFALWRSLATVDHVLQSTAERADRVRSLLTSWRTWRRKGKEHTDQRWNQRKAQLKEVYVLVKERRDAAVLRQGWQSWQQSLRDRRAATFRNGHLLGGAFFLWHIKLGVSSALAGQEAALRHKRDERTRQSALSAWAKAATLSIHLRHWEQSHSSAQVESLFGLWHRWTSLRSLAQAYDRQRLQRSTLQTWLQRLSQTHIDKRRQMQADRLHAHHSKQTALRRWTTSLKKTRDRTVQALTYRDATKERLLQAAVERWRLQSRLRLLHRVRAGRLQKSALLQWRQRRKFIAVTMQTQALQIASRQTQRSAADCLSHWRLVSKRYGEAYSAAEQLSAHSAALSMLRQWRAALAKRAAASERAAAADIWFIQKRTLDKLRHFAHCQRLRRWQNQSSQRLQQDAFEAWRMRAKQHVAHRLGVAAVQSRAEERIQRDCLEQWMSRVIERRALLLQVGDAYSERLVATSFDQWRKSRLRVHELNSLGDSLRDIKRQETLRRCMQEWTYRQRKLRSLQERVGRLVSQNTRRALAAAMDRWYEKYREEHLRDAEVDVVTARQDRAKIRTLAIWIGRTKPIPALHFHHTRLKAVAMKRWREKFPLAVRHREAAEVYAQSTTTKALAHWAEKAKSRRTARAAARFGGPSMGARLKRHSARLPSPFVVRPRRSIPADDDSGRPDPLSDWEALNDGATEKESRQGGEDELLPATVAYQSRTSGSEQALASEIRRERPGSQSDPRGPLAPPSANSEESSVPTATFSSSRPSRTAQSEFAYAPRSTLAQRLATYHRRIGDDPDGLSASSDGPASRRRPMSVHSEGFIGESTLAPSSTQTLLVRGTTRLSYAISPSRKADVSKFGERPSVKPAKEGSNAFLEDLRRRRLQLSLEQQEHQPAP